MEELKAEMETKYQKMESLREKVRILEEEEAVLQEKLRILQDEIEEKQRAAKPLRVEINREFYQRHAVYKKLSELRETRTRHMPKDEIEQTKKDIEKYVEGHKEYLQKLVRISKKYFRRHIEDRFDIRVSTKCIYTDAFSFAYQFDRIADNLRTM